VLEHEQLPVRGRMASTTVIANNSRSLPLDTKESVHERRFSNA
jgi:hypothetical protein